MYETREQQVIISVPVNEWIPIIIGKQAGIASFLM